MPTFNELFAKYNVSIPNDFVINNLCLDSRNIQVNDVFFALAGTNGHGKQYIDQALANGAKAIVLDDADNDYQPSHISIPNLKAKLPEIAAGFFANPAHNLQVVGVTGTNGKTSVTHFIANILHELNNNAGIIGTLGNGEFGKLQTATLTTPDVISLQALFANFQNRGIKHVAMEVSSHSLVQQRVAGIPFKVGVFTNLTRDHLDYHGSMQNYADAKLLLLHNSLTEQILINTDDEYGRKFAERNFGKPTFGYGLKPNGLTLPFITAQNIAHNSTGTTADLISPWGNGKLSTNLLGEFNLSNLLAAIGVVSLLGHKLPDIISTIPKIRPVAGRMQIVKSDPTIIIDYAHTPDALQNVLQTLRQHNPDKLFCVFGCGGDRDPGKRPLMAKVAEKFSDYVVVTDDNPRHENSNDIIRQIMSGFNDKSTVAAVPSRASAIQKVLELAGEKDFVVIAGKGAEEYQIIGDRKVPFNDASEVKKFFAKETINGNC